MMRVFEVEDGVESGLCGLFFYFVDRLKKNKIANPKPNRRQKSRKLKNFKLGPQVKVTGHHPVTK